MKNPKYKLIRAGRMKIHRTNDTENFYRLQALCDIPEHNVKTGDLGGYVTKKKNLSQEGPCWIGGDAQVIGNVKVSERAYIGGSATVRVHEVFMQTYAVSPIIIKGGTRIEECADILTIRKKSEDPYGKCILEGNIKIYGNASLHNVFNIYGNAKIYENARLVGSGEVSGASEVFGNAIIGESCTIKGKSKVFDDAIIGANATIIDSIIAGKSNILNHQNVIDGKTNEVTIGSSNDDLMVVKAAPSRYDIVLPPAPSWDQMAGHKSIEPTPKAKVYLGILKEIKDKIATYESDIVKIIKYPVMTDRTNPFTQEMVIAVNNAQRWSEDPDGNEFKDAIKELERAFLAAESNALKIALSSLSDEERRKAQKAQDLLAIASDGASSENEKKMSFEQAFKQLEGVIMVPEVAVDAFRIKIGLKELES
jgi:carbonic anhydrase/acetyltransferase-like protein (isoleucine patch superfamily)